jgi:ubiquinone/menaquinone biosynthesis C-methylase UbiE
METAEYRTMYDLETSYWWFRNIHDIMTDMLDVSPGSRLLDAGCGTGGLLLRLRELSPNSYGFDLSADALPFWHERGIDQHTALASINEIPYAENSFDAVISVDILEVDGVDDQRAYSELVRVTKPGGRVLLVVPAYQWMMTAGHHQAVHAVRRYNKKSVRALAAGLPLTIERVTHGFAFLFPLVGGVRLWNRWQERRGNVEVKSELQPYPPLINNTLYGITNLERYLLRHMDMPFGSSLIMVARKV